MHIPFLEKNTLECRLKAARAELGAFKSGKKYQDMQEMHRKEVQALECRIRHLEEGLAQARRDLKANTRHWMEVFDDLKKEHQKEVAALMKRLARMEERALRAERERDECKDKITQQRHRIYEVETALEEEKGKNTRLKAQLVHHCINNQVISCHQRHTLISPLEGLCHKIVLLNKPQNACFQFFNRFIALPFENAPVYDAKPDFNLAHPGTMLWCIYNSYPVVFPMEEFRTAFQALQYTGLPFTAKVFLQATLLCNEPDQAFRFMRVQAIAHKRP